MALFPLDGPSDHGQITATTTEQEIKVGASALSERKVITLQPQDGKVRVLFKTGLAASFGIEILKGDVYSFEASQTQPVYILTETGSVVVNIIERA